MITTEAIIEDILRREDWPTFTIRKHDRGGPTKGGITLATLTHWRKRDTTLADLEALTLTEAKEIYQQIYIVGPKLHLIPDGFLRAHVADCCVLHGQGNAIKLLQRALGLRTPTGLLGIWTETAVAKDDPARVNGALFDHRLRFICNIVQHDLTQAVNLEGWINRALEFKIWERS